MLATAPVRSEEITATEISYANFNSYRIYFDGAFERGSYQKLVTMITELNASGGVVGTIEFNSKGGLVEEAIQIGDYIRQNRIATIAPANNSDTQVCASACALAWLGGVYRIGTVLAHRSYLEDPTSSLSFNDWDESLSSSQKQIRNYLERNRVPQSVLELILSIRSTQEISLSAGSDVAIMDSIFEEFLISRCGARLSVDERAVLQTLIWAEEEGRVDNDLMYSVALRLLREKFKNWQECALIAMFEAQSQAQL